MWQNTCHMLDEMINTLKLYEFWGRMSFSPTGMSRIVVQYKLWVNIQAAHLTMQSCMILFQSSPVTMRKRTVMALPAVEKLACLRWEDGEPEGAAFFPSACIKVFTQTEMRSKKKKNLPVDVLSIFDSPKEHDSGEGVAEEQQEHADDDEKALVHADDHRQQQHLQRDLHSKRRRTVQWLHRGRGLPYRHSLALEQRCPHVLPAYGKEPEDNHTGPHHVGVCVLKGGEKKKHFECWFMDLPALPRRDTDANQPAARSAGRSRWHPATWPAGRSDSACSASSRLGTWRLASWLPGQRCQWEV